MLLIDRTLLRLAKGLWGWILAIALVRFGALVCMTRFAGVIGGSLGEMLSGSAGLDLASSVWAAVLLTAGLLAARILQGELEYWCASKARMDLRDTIFSKVLELDAGNVEKIGPVSAVTSSVDAVESMQVYYSTYLPGLLFSIAAPVYLYLHLRHTSALIAGVLLAVSLVLLPINNLFRARIEERRKSYWGTLEDMTSYYLDSIRGMTTVKLFRRTQERTVKLTEKAEKLNTEINAFMKINFLSFLATEGMIYAAILAAAFIACAQMSKGTMNMAQGLTVLLLSYSFFSAIRTLMSATHNALTAVAAASRVEEILDVDTSRPYEPDMPEEANAYEGIEMRDVSFRYEGRQETLQNITLQIPKGKVSAFVGLSGCGKSTAASLLMRFMDPQHGQILLEGKDYVSMTPEEVRRHVALVPQTVSIFSGTLRQNLLIAREDASDEELMHALEEAGLLEYVQNHPDGLNADVGEAGAKLSGGQKQKIGIARALLSDAPYMIFDEATSSVDPESEMEIRRCIASLAKTRTLIIISHRLSAIRSADCIYVLERGRIRESGTHEELMRRNGLYARLTAEQDALEGSLP